MLNSAMTSSLTPSFHYDANTGLYQPSHDPYHLWYQQSVNFNDFGQHQQSTQPADVQRSMEPNQPQESSDEYYQMTSDIPQNYVSPSFAKCSRNPPQKTPSNRTIHVLQKDRHGNSNSSGDKIFKRRPGACTRCKQLKMKCDFAPGELACQRCKPKGYHCVVDFPKPKVYERERLLNEIRQKDAIIETLLMQLHNPYCWTPRSIDEYVKSIPPSDVDNPIVLSFPSRLKSSVQLNSTEGSMEGDTGRLTHDPQYNLHPHSEAQEHEEMPAATTESFRVPVWSRPARKAQEISPGLGFRLGDSKAHNYPEILGLGIVTLADAKQLFDIFYTYINPFITLLDPNLLTPISTLARCPILFTVICAISSRYHPRKSNIFQLAMRFAKQSAANALVLDGMKSVELCQAYILLSIYAVPQRSWDQDQTWLYTGLAISIATALRLNQTPRINLGTEKEEREYLNRIRVWEYCFLMEQALAIQGGKPWLMKDDMIIHHSEEWYKQSRHSLDHDVYLYRHNALVRIVARFYQDVFLGGSAVVSPERGNLRNITMRYDMEIEIFKEEWMRRFEAEGVHREAMLTRSQLCFYTYYYKLVIFSYGFHQVFQAGVEVWHDYFFIKCLGYAKSRNWRLADLCVVFLFKLLRAEFSSLLGKADKDEIVKLIGITINKLSSSDIAVDNRHTPKLYARFLASKLSKYPHSDQGATLGGSRTVLPQHTDTSKNITGETNGERRDRSQRPTIAQEYDSAGFTFPSQVSPAADSWSTQSETDLQFHFVMNGVQNINGKYAAGDHPGSMQNETPMSIYGYDNPDWLEGTLMLGFTWNSSERGQSANYAP